MQVFQSHEKLSYYDRDVFFGDQARLQEIRTTTPGTKLHDDPKIGTLQKGAMVFRYVGRMEFGQDGYFLDNVLDFVLRILNVDDLDRYRLSRSLVDPMATSERL